METNNSTRIIKLSFSGQGGEMQFHRLNQDDITQLRKQYTEEKDAFLLNNLNGGESFTETVHTGSYGAFIDQAVFINEDGTEFNLKDFGEPVQAKYVTDENPLEEMADYFYLTFGEINGTLSVPVPSGEPFYPSKLVLSYVEYSFENYPEEYGKIMIGGMYEGRRCLIKSSDDGQELRRIVIYPQFDSDGNFEEYDVLIDQNRGDYAHILL